MKFLLIFKVWIGILLEIYMERGMEMAKKKLKIVGIVSAGVLALVLAGGYLVGDYFVDYALASKGPDYHDPLSPTYEKGELELANLAINDAKVAHLEELVGYEEITIETVDGLKLYAKEFVQPVVTNDWLVAVHGYTSSHETVIDVAADFYEQGYNVIVPDLRGHGLSEGDWITMGWKDGRDVVSIAEYIVDKNAQAEIVLFGQSMGAATVMMAAGDDALPEQVKVVIEDCGYTHAYTMFTEQLEARFGLPSFPILDLAALVGRLQVGINLKEISPEKALENADVPILFIHGLEDGFVLPYMVYELYDSYQGEKELMVVEGADHTASRNLERERYYDTVYSFIAQHK